MFTYHFDWIILSATSGIALKEIILLSYMYKENDYEKLII